MSNTTGQWAPFPSHSQMKLKLTQHPVGRPWLTVLATSMRLAQLSSLRHHTLHATCRREGRRFIYIVEGGQEAKLLSTC